MQLSVGMIFDFFIYLLLYLFNHLFYSCSHGYCRACIETHIRSNSNSHSNNLKQNLCPICIDEDQQSPIKKQESDTSSSSDSNGIYLINIFLLFLFFFFIINFIGNSLPTMIPYYRSSNLDSLVYLLQLASGELDMKVNDIIAINLYSNCIL